MSAPTHPWWIRLHWATRLPASAHPSRRPSILLSLLLSGWVSLAGCGGNSSPGIPPALPDSTTSLDPVLAEAVEAQAAVVRKNSRSGEEHIRLAVIYEANELWQLARRSYENATKLDPTPVEWVYRAALCAASDGDSAHARTVYRQIASSHPDFAPARHAHGLSLLDEGDLEAAEVELEAARRLRGSIAESHAALAQLRLLQGRHQDALELAENAVRLSGGSPRARFVRGQALRGLGRVDAAEPDLAAGAGARPGRLQTPIDSQLPRNVYGVQVQVDRAADLIEAGRASDAITILEKALADRPDHRALSINLAVAYQQTGQVKRSIPILERLNREDPRDTPVLLNLAEALWQTKNHKRGDEVTARAIEVQTDQGLAHFARARVLYALRKIPEAITHCERAVELEPQNPEIRTALAEGYVMTQKFADAEREFRRAIDLSPRVLSHRTNLCAVLIRQGKRQEAETLLRALGNSNPDHPKVMALQDLFFRSEGVPVPASGRSGTP